MALRGLLDVGMKHLKKNSNTLVVGLLLLGNLLMIIKLTSKGDKSEEAVLGRSERMLRDRGQGEDEQGGQQSLQWADDGGAVFTRWGRTSCPQDDQLVYAGIAGGGHYTHKGSGSNYVCLPMDPIYDKTLAGVQNPAIIYGAEYEVNFDVFSAANSNVGTLQQHNVPCAVCRSTTHRAALMIPGRNACYRDWRMEYTGYLMSSHHTHEGRTEFVCVDGEPEADQAGFRDENGALFYHVEGACGSLPCPPYDNGKELTCVVCTK